MKKINSSELILYQTEDGQTKLEVRLHDETVWLTQKMMAELFQVSVPTINEHIKNIYSENELEPKATIRKFLIVQNKMHWAAHGHTATELIYKRVNFKQNNMGITNFPGKHLLKRDVEIAKNYLNETELNILNRIVTAYLEVAELQALNQAPMTMKDWSDRLHEFLIMTGREILDHAGKISHNDAIQKAREEYEKFRVNQLKEPSLAEKHFIEAEAKLRKIEKTKK